MKLNKKPLLLLLLNFFLLSSSFSQETFLQTYDYESGQSKAYGAVKSDSGNFLIGGYQYKESTWWIKQFQLIKIDSTGRKLWKKTFANFGRKSRDDNPYMSITSGGLCGASDGGTVLAGGYRKDTTEDPDAYLLRVNAHGDSLWHYRLKDSNITQYYDVTQTRDSGFVAVGYGQTNQYNVFPVVTKVGKNGHKEWERMLMNDTASMFSVTKAHDSGVVITGPYYDPLGNVDSDPEAYVVKINPSGQIVWNRHIGNPQMVEKGQHITRGYNKGYAIAGNVFGENTVTKNWFLKVDSNGQFVGSNRIEGSTEPDWTRAITKTGNGDYMFAGHDLNSESHFAFARLDRYGNKIWYKSFSELGYIYPSDLIKAGKNRYLVVGDATKTKSSWKSQTFALMFDGQGNYSSIRKAEQQQKPPYNLYPNPFQDKLNIEAEKQKSSHQITLMNSSGQVVLEKTLKQSTLQVQNLNTGLYFYRISDQKGQLIQQGKLIKVPD